MQSNKGTWRRVDELGRVVIPKEIRVYLNVKPGDIIEFSVLENNNVNMRKYHRLDDISDIANICTSATTELLDAILLIVSSDKVIATTHRAFNNLNITNAAGAIHFVELDTSHQELLSDKILHSFPIISNGDQHGTILLYTSTTAQDTNITIARVLARLLSKYLER